MRAQYKSSSRIRSDRSQTVVPAPASAASAQVSAESVTPVARRRPTWPSVDAARFRVGIPVGNSGGSWVGSFEVPPLLAPFALVSAQIRTACRVATYICVCMYISDIRSGPGAQGRMYSTGAGGHCRGSARCWRGVLAEAASARSRGVYSARRGDTCTCGLRWWCA